jgi:hypothetical protein
LYKQFLKMKLPNQSNPLFDILVSLHFMLQETSLQIEKISALIEKLEQTPIQKNSFEEIIKSAQSYYKDDWENIGKN